MNFCFGVVGVGGGDGGWGGGGGGYISSGENSLSFPTLPPCLALVRSLTLVLRCHQVWSDPAAMTGL